MAYWLCCTDVRTNTTGPMSKTPSPLTLRPICQLPEIYKLYVRLRKPLFDEALSARCDAHVCGGRKHTNLLQLVAGTQLHLARAQALGRTVGGLHSDLSLCYEKVPLDIMQQVMLRKGIPDT
eukprot:3408437-Amphidinium_carterae.1